MFDCQVLITKCLILTFYEGEQRQIPLKVYALMKLTQGATEQRILTLGVCSFWEMLNTLAFILNYSSSSITVIILVKSICLLQDD